MEENKFVISNTLISHLEQTARIERALAVRYFNEKRELNISFNEVCILSCVKANPGIHQRDLARQVLIGTSNLSRALEVLEEKKLIIRKTEAKDKRAVKTLYLTKSGEKQFNKIVLSVEKYVKEIESIYTEKEYQQFNEYLLRLRSRLTESIDMVFE